MSSYPVTGGRRFIRSHLCDALRARDHAVRAVEAMTPHYPRALKQANISSPSAGANRSGQGIPILASAEDLPEMATRLGIERVVLSFSSESDEELLGPVHALQERGVQVDVIPRLSTRSVHALTSTRSRASL
jgi:FlaA1/EpsC-like NDP-sugar epimerase